MYVCVVCICVHPRTSYPMLLVVVAAAGHGTGVHGSIEIGAAASPRLAGGLSIRRAKEGTQGV